MHILSGLVGGISEILDQLVDEDGVKDEDWSTTQAGLDFDLTVLDGRRVDGPDCHTQASGFVKHEDIAMEPARLLDAGLPNLQLDMVVKWLGREIQADVAGRDEGPDTARPVVIWILIVHDCKIVFEQSDVNMLAQKAKLEGRLLVILLR